MSADVPDDASPTDQEDRRREGDRRRQAEATYGSLVEQIPAITYIDPISEDEPSLYVSPQLKEILGYEPEVWIEDMSFWHQHVHPDDEAEAWASYVACRETGEPRHSEYRMFARDGSVVWIEERAHVVLDDGGTPWLLQGVMFDVTERKRAEAMKDAVLRAVSHDLRSPISAVIGSAVTLLGQDASIEADDVKALLDGIVLSAQRMDRLVNDLLDLDRLESGGITARRESTDVTGLAAEVVAGLETDRVVLEQTEPLVAVVDRVMAERIVENLTINALRHTPPSTQISVDVQRGIDGGGVTISVTDAGKGIPDDRKEQLFEPFERGSDEHGGAGIGLTLVRAFAELHGGRAWIEDTPGGGATFKVYLALEGDADGGTGG